MRVRGTGVLSAVRWAAGEASGSGSGWVESSRVEPSRADLLQSQPPSGSRSGRRAASRAGGGAGRAECGRRRARGSKRNHGPGGRAAPGASHCSCVQGGDGAQRGWRVEAQRRRRQRPKRGATQCGRGRSDSHSRSHIDSGVAPSLGAVMGVVASTRLGGMAREVGRGERSQVEPQQREQWRRGGGTRRARATQHNQSIMTEPIEVGRWRVMAPLDGCDSVHFPLWARASKPSFGA